MKHSKQELKYQYKQAGETPVRVVLTNETWSKLEAYQKRLAASLGVTRVSRATALSKLIADNQKQERPS